MRKIVVALLTAIALTVTTGCVNSHVIKDTTEPDITVDDFGAITFKGKRIELENLARAVKSAGIKRNQEVNILVPERFDTMRRNQIYSQMLRGGYTRTIFVTDRKATSYIVSPKP